MVALLAAILHGIHARLRDVGETAIERILEIWQTGCRGYNWDGGGHGPTNWRRPGSS